MSVSYDAGRVVPLWRGQWTPGGTYEKLDVVSYNGSSYVWMGESLSVGVEPNEINDWNPVASKGDTGATGPAGPSGGGAGVPIAEAYPAGDTWHCAVPSLATLGDGQQILLVFGESGVGAMRVNLTLSGGAQTGPIPVYRSRDRIPLNASAFGGGQAIRLTYLAEGMGGITAPSWWIDTIDMSGVPTYDLSLMHMTNYRINCAPVGSFDICLQRVDGLMDRLTTVSGSTAPDKPANASADFRVDGLMLTTGYIGPTSGPVTITSVSNQPYWTLNGYVSDYVMSTTFNGVDHLTEASWLYLVGIPQANPSLFRLDDSTLTSWYTTVEPTAADGRVYIRIGWYSYGEKFAMHMPMKAFCFRDGAFRPYV